jgi:hypothetical protein
VYAAGITSSGFYFLCSLPALLFIWYKIAQIITPVVELLTKEND